MTSPDEVLDALATLARSPVAVTVDLHRGHLDAAVATLPLPPARAARVVHGARSFLDGVRALGIPVIHVVTAYRHRDEILSNAFWRFQAGRHGSPRAAIAEHNLEGGPGLQLMPGVRQPGDLLVRTKKRYDGFEATDLELVLRSAGADSILLLGVNTNSCVLATAIRASVLDFAVFVIEDGVDTMLSSDLHDAACAVVAASFGWVVDGATALGALGDAGRTVVR